MKKIINKEWLGGFLYYSFIISYFVEEILDILFGENLWYPKISLIIFLIRRLFLIILSIMAIKDKCMYYGQSWHVIVVGTIQCNCKVSHSHQTIGGQ